MKIEGEYKNIYLIEKKLENTVEEMKNTFPGHKICVCDFYIAGSEDGKIAEDGAILFDGLLIIDHHPAIPIMRRHVSSTTFANLYVTEHGPLDDNYAVVINHTDADSILSSLIMSGILNPSDEYSLAAIEADHIGGENLISDLLQALEDDRCLDKSIDVFQKILKRIKVRQELKALANNGEFKFDSGIAYKLLDGKIDAGFLPWLFPNADAIIVGWAMPKGSKGKWGIKTRLGIATNDIALNEMDLPDTGGRWDAVSTTRHGGTNTEFEEYVKLVRKKLGAEKAANNGST